jgi:alpha-beta hydrolase superfamily lysophospholipase
MRILRLVLVCLLLAAPAAAQKLVSFPTQDGGVVYADLYGQAGRGVVLAHGALFNKESWAKQARPLAKAGFRVLAIDFRGHGQSRGGPGTPRSLRGLSYDVLAAVRYLHKTGSKSVSVVGASMGGGASARAATEAKPGEIDRLVLLAAVAIKDPQKMQGRKLFIVSRHDMLGNGTPRLSVVREQYRKAPGPKRLLVLPGSAHAQNIFATSQGPRLFHAILQFLSAP